MLKKRITRAFTIVLLISMLLPIVASCTKDDPKINEKVLFTLNIDGAELKPTELNKSEKLGDIAVYDRDYKLDDTHALKIGGKHTDRIVVVIDKTKEYGEFVYRLTALYSDETEKNNVLIPYNGFVVSVAKASLTAEEIDKIGKTDIGKRVSVVGFTEEKPYEDQTRGLVLVDSVSKRLNLRNPSTSVSDNSIVFLDAEAKEFAIPEGSYAIKLAKSTALRYKFGGVVSGKTTPGNYYLIFSGEYNIQFGKQICTGEEIITLSNLSLVASDTDKPSVTVKNKNYELFGADNNIPVISADGVYLYNTDYFSATSPETSLNFVEVVVNDGSIIWIGEQNKKLLIPKNKGYLISFVGTAANDVETLVVGDAVSETLVSLPTHPSRYVRIGKTGFEVTGYNSERSDTDIIVYSSDFSDSTGTADNGLEIVVKDNIVTEIHKQAGNSTIPDGGYVISAAASNDKYSFALKAKVGDEVYLSPVPLEYVSEEMKFTSINTTRSENFIVIYDGSDGKKTTGTNQWGFEVSVSEDSKLISKRGGGDSEIPVGGYVISAHGDENTKKLQELYSFGATVFINKDEKEFSIVKTPALKAEMLSTVYAEVENRYKAAKENLIDLNYAVSDAYMASLKSDTDQITKLLSEAKYAQAMMLVDTVSSKLEKTKYLFTESFVIENRAVWYRPVEKSEAEVENTVKRVKELNLTTIYIETWYEGYTIFDQIESEYVIKNPYFGDLDVLAAFIKYGKQYGIEIHAWVETFFVGVYGGNNNKLNNLLDLRLLSKSGYNYFPYFDQKYIFLNPYDKRAQDIVYGVYDALINNYDIDGLNHDYIRFPEPVSESDDYGYNADIIAGYQKEYNTTKDPKTFTRGSKDWIDWCKFREDIITEFVYNIYDMIQESGKDIKISCALYPNVDQTRTTIFQNAKSWVDAGIIDEAFTMSYFLDVPSVESNAKRVSVMTADKAFFSVGIASFIEVDLDVFCEQITAIRKYPGTGIAIFSLNALLGSQYSEPLIVGQFRNESIPGYKYEKVASVGAADVIRKIDELYSVVKPEAKAELDALKIKFEALKTKSDSSAILSKDRVAQAVIVNEWLNDIKSISNDIKSASSFDDKLKAALREDIELIRIYLARAHSRLTVNS